MMKPIKNVTLVPGEKKHIPDAEIEKILDILSSLSCRVKMEKRYEKSAFFHSGAVISVSREELFDGSELIIVMGGDGSVIEVARTSAEYNIPIVGINFGRLGFLAELEVSETSLLKQIIEGNFETDERMMLDVSVIRNGKETYLPYPCLNDVVLSNAPVSRLSGFDLYCDGIYISRYSADGIVISTPTGSSAYSMSAGGPLVSQSMECILATPICPHSFTLRPLVLMGDSVIEIKNAVCRENSMFITADGRENTEIFSGDVVVIKKSLKKTRLVKVKSGGFVSVLHRKITEMESGSL